MPCDPSSAAAARRDPTIRNVTLLAICQGLAMSSSTLIVAISALVGYSLADNKIFATLPLAFVFGTTMVTTFPASLLMQRWGRRVGFSLGAIFGLASGLTCALAIFIASFPLFCLGSSLFGISSAHVFYYRFAAADTASDAMKSRAISWVLAGGVVAAFLGPELAKWSRDLFAPVLFAGGFLCIAGLSSISLVLLQFIDIPRPRLDKGQGRGRPLSAIVREPKFVVAALCAMVGYGAMNFVMTSTPLAMVACAHPFESAALVIQWHVVAMFAPSFVTGYLIKRLGLLPILATGVVLVLACVAVNLTGVAVVQFWFALVFLGLGWNFLFVGGTTLLTEVYQPAERAKVQGLNDLLVFGSVALTALLSGIVFHGFGWQVINLAVIAPLGLVCAGLLWIARQRGPMAA